MITVSHLMLSHHLSSPNLASKIFTCLAVCFLHRPKHKTSPLRLPLRLQRGQLFLQQFDLIICILRCKHLLLFIYQPTSGFINLRLRPRIGISRVDFHIFTGVISLLAFVVFRILWFARSRALQNRLTAAMASLTARSQNQLMSKGLIEDADYAKETATLSKQQILFSIASQMLVNAQQSKDAILGLI